MEQKTSYKELLDHIDPSVLDYNDWVAVGMAIKHEGGSAYEWDLWSKRDAARYKAGDCYRKWESFREEAGGVVTGGTLFKLACDAVWRPGGSGQGEALTWDDIIGGNDREGVVVDANWIEGKEIHEPSDKEWNPVKEIVTYLQTLFDSTENVGYVTESWFNKDASKYMPTKGSCSRTAGELIEDLNACNGDIGSVLGDYNEKCGAWVRFNPLDGNGVKNTNVTDFRYALVESDSMAIEKQNEIIRAMELPVAVMVHSGGKSLHAIVRIDAKDYDEYRKRVDYLYAVCEKNGLAIDKQNRNPSRLSRLPGVTRNGRKQFIVDVGIGKKDFAEWQEWIEAVNDNLPDPESMADAWDNLPELAPPLIDGVLRQGHKMLLAGPSKAGKSFALIELAISIAEGVPWFGWICAKGRVMYVNLELDRASCLHRFRDVYEANGLKPDHLGNIDIWNLRGKSVPMDKLAPKLIRRAKSKNYIAVIIDPIYKVITGDENSADQMAHFCNQFDKVCTELGCATIYCHHHSKGEQAGKRSMDRASGSGVFARDPDALIDMMELYLDEDLIKAEQNKAACRAVADWLTAHRPEWEEEVGPDERLSANQMLEYAMGHATDEEYKALLSGVVEPAKKAVLSRTAWMLDGTLREFPKFKPRTLWFDYPTHTVDDTGILEDAAKKTVNGGVKMRKFNTRNLGRKKDSAQREKDRRISVESAFEALASMGEPVTLKSMAEYVGKTEKTVKKYVKEHGGFLITNHQEVIRNERNNQK